MATQGQIISSWQPLYKRSSAK